MEDPGQPIRYLTAQQICAINADLIASFGGWRVTPSNLRDEGGLDYALAATSHLIFGLHDFPTAIDKAAGLAWYIITRHPFHDTNKRTAMEAAIEFLELNGFGVHFDSGDIVEVTLATQSGRMNYNDFREWLAANVHASPP